MAGFRKAVCQQAAIKCSMYGPPGSGKTFSALLFAEGLAKHTQKRIAYVDTENGTHFYSTAVPGREYHPEAFDFDVLSTRSLTEVLKEAKAVIKGGQHSVIVLDSISHLWDAAMAAYTGPRLTSGGIPLGAWSKIKAPYKELVKLLIDSPLHVFILGRQANVFESDEDGEMRAGGVKMRAEGETAYEPHICLRMISERTTKQGKKTVVLKEQTICAIAEKDRTGLLSCKRIEWPNFDNVIAPIIGILTPGDQAQTPSEDEAASRDAEALAQAERAKLVESSKLRADYLARFQLADTLNLLKHIGGELTPAVKKCLTSQDLAAVRAGYLEHESRLKGLPQPVKAAVDQEPTNGEAEHAMSS